MSFSLNDLQMKCFSFRSFSAEIIHYQTSAGSNQASWAFLQLTLMFFVSCSGMSFFHNRKLCVPLHFWCILLSSTPFDAYQLLSFVYWLNVDCSNFHYLKKEYGKVLFTDCYTWQKFHLILLRLENNCLESIYKTQKSKTKVLPCVTVDE